MDSTTATFDSLRSGDLIRLRTNNGGRMFAMYVGGDVRHQWDAGVGMALPVRFVRVANRSGVTEIDVARISHLEIVLTEAERAAVAS